ncbi:spindle and kinetochore-associated protein 2-like isoform X2 [Micropterus salmoides]|uniref:spindle and kinetochore-associated protein 2-like isoform X2 n=1 Tax=Micropterus salmoides TaxID=27706 RepID=UPI0018EC85E2|nr:spindle and kinetochore-associated protein 2-like isoform X2 [Micropterus salmoides]XP_045894923.1 spindle and kinetochore-associated protein 2 isoform X2 [Micropterus dolomieu]
METTVEKLEAMFLKSEADLEYIEKRLKLDFINNAAENRCPTEENPAVMLENLRAIKAKHTALCSQVKEIAAAQKESMDSITNNLSSVMDLIQHFQQTTDVEVQPLTESVQESAELLGSTVRETTTEVLPAAAASGQQQTLSCEYEELSEAMLEAVPLSILSKIKLDDLNVFYKQLQQHFSRNSSGSLSIQKMKQLKMKVSEAKLKVLQHLSLVELDKKGHVRLVM